MTLETLIRRFRALSGDKVPTYFWKDADIIDWLSDAQVQACVRGRLLVAEGDPALCEISLTPGQSTYPLHRALYELIDLRIAAPTGMSRPVTLKSREWLNAELPDWRAHPRHCSMAIQTETGLRLVGSVEAGEILFLEAYRLPLAPMAAPADPDAPGAVWPEPEIHEAHHEHLIQWALHKAFSVPDAETFDPQRSALAEDSFTAYFGLMPDSDMRRTTREDVQHLNKVYL